MMRDAGRRALVTGASGGIGRAVAAELRARGMRVVGLDRRNADAPDIVRCDLTHDGEVRAAVADAVDRLGGLEVVVNVAGASGRHLGDGPIDACTDEAWDWVLDVNLRSVFHVSRATLPHLSTGASIVHMTSVLGLRGGDPAHFATHAYAAAKGAIVSLTTAMATTYAERGIRVNAVAPGLVETPMSRRAQDDPRLLAYIAARQRLTGGMLQPEDVARAVAFLASTASAGITGVVLPVDGGWTAS